MVGPWSWKPDHPSGIMENHSRREQGCSSSLLSARARHPSDRSLQTLPSVSGWPDHTLQAAEYSLSITSPGRLLTTDPEAAAVGASWEERNLGAVGPPKNITVMTSHFHNQAGLWSTVNAAFIPESTFSMPTCTPTPFQGKFPFIHSLNDMSLHL